MHQWSSCAPALLQILGDRSLKYRYLNPNLLFVATGPSPSASGQVSPDEQSVSVTILNTVTGGVLHTQVHQGCAGPVHAVVSENWIVYVMRNLEALRTQVRPWGRQKNWEHGVLV